MKIEKRKNIYGFYHYYLDSKTNTIIAHGLFNGLSSYISSIGYIYHNNRKGFYLLDSSIINPHSSNFDFLVKKLRMCYQKVVKFMVKLVKFISI